MNHLTTETRNIQTMHLDEMNLSDALKTMNQEDQLVPKAIEPVIPNLTKVIESAIQRFNNGGRIIYIGAGTSCLLYTSPSPRDGLLSRMPSSA